MSELSWTTGYPADVEELIGVGRYPRKYYSVTCFFFFSSMSTINNLQRQAVHRSLWQLHSEADTLTRAPPVPLPFQCAWPLAPVHFSLATCTCTPLLRPDTGLREPLAWKHWELGGPSGLWKPGSWPPVATIYTPDLPRETRQVLEFYLKITPWLDSFFFCTPASPLFIRFS